MTPEFCSSKHSGVPLCLLFPLNVPWMTWCGPGVVLDCSGPSWTSLPHGSAGPCCLTDQPLSCLLAASRSEEKELLPYWGESRALGVSRDMALFLTCSRAVAAAAGRCGCAGSTSGHTGMKKRKDHMCQGPRNLLQPHRGLIDGFTKLVLDFI